MEFRAVSGNVKWLLALTLFSTGCATQSGALGPNGYEQSVVKYQVQYADVASKKFLPDDWALDNYAYNSSKGQWKEKTGEEYRAVRWLDEDGDGTVSISERHKENIFDLRFVNQRDNAVIWLKVHPLAFADSKRDLGVVLENYADGLGGTGLFEQSSLFGLKTDKARQYTTFVVSETATKLGPLAAIRGVIEIADVQKLRIDPAHRDSKAKLIFARVSYPVELTSKPSNPTWPVTRKVVDNGNGGETAKYTELRTGLLVVGYYNDAARFDAHLSDFRALLHRIQIPAAAIPQDNNPPTLQATVQDPASNAAPGAVAPSVPPATAAPSPAISAPPVEPLPSAAPFVPPVPSAAPAASSSSVAPVSSAAPVSVAPATPVPRTPPVTSPKH